MSYYFWQTRLAGISRSIADNNPAGASGSMRLSYYAHIMTMDAEFAQMIHGGPLFLNIDTYDEHTRL